MYMDIDLLVGVNGGRGKGGWGRVLWLYLAEAHISMTGFGPAYDTHRHARTMLYTQTSGGATDTNPAFFYHVELTAMEWLVHLMTHGKSYLCSNYQIRLRQQYTRVILVQLY